MENTILNKSLIKRILIALVFVTIFNFIVPYYSTVSFADSYTEQTEKEAQLNKETPGGVWLVPIKSLLNFMADSILEILQNSFVSQFPVVIPARAKSEGEINGWLIAGIVVGGVAITIGTIATCGLASAALAGEIALLTAIKGVAGGVMFTAATFTGVAIATKEVADEIEGEFELPLIMYSPEKIFSNEIPLFDINFINPQTQRYENIITYKPTATLVTEIKSWDNATVEQVEYTQLEAVYTSNKEEWIEKCSTSKGYSKDLEIKVNLAEEMLSNRMGQLTRNDPENFGRVTSYESDYLAWKADGKIKLCVYLRYIIGEQMNQETDSLSFLQVLANLFRAALGEDSAIGESGTNYYEELQNEELLYIEINEEDLNKLNNENTVTYTYQSSAQILQTTVASWYKTLRTLAIVALLTILVYIGIRIVLSSTAKDKAKYKQMIMDWLIGLVLIFVLHYVMSFILYISSELTKICKNSNIENIIIQIPEDTEIVKYAEDDEGNSKNTYVSITDELNVKLDELGYEKSDDGTKWSTNYIGMIRFMSGLPNREFAYKSFGYTVMYIVLVIYTCAFTFMYLKRVLWMAFLTMISPLVAITYPIDKVNDGQAQGFKLWLKEYIFNALLQPIHYLIYTIIMGSVMSLVKEYPVYAVVALGFLMPAEKFIRKMFGFEKAETVSAFGGVASAAFLMGNIRKLQSVFRGNNDDDEKQEENKTNNTKIGNNTNPYGFLNGKLNPTQADKNEPTKKGKTGIKNPVKKSKLRIKRDIKVPTKKGKAQPKKVKKPKNGQNQNKYKKSNNSSKVAKARRIRKSGNGQNRTNFAARRYKQVSRKGGNRFKRTNNSNLKKKRPSKLKNGFKVMKGYYTRRLYKKAKKWRPVRAMRRGIAFTTGAAIGGAVAGAATIIDPQKAETYLTAGIYGGGKLAVGVSDKASKMFNIKGGAKAFKRGIKGEKYDDIEKKEKLREFKMDNKNYIASVGKFGAEGTKKLYKKDGVLDKCFEEDITDRNDIFKINKTKNKLLETDLVSKDLSAEEREKEATKKAIMSHKIGETFGDITNDKEKEENFNKILKERGFTKDQVKDFKETFQVYQES